MKYILGFAGIFLGQLLASMFTDSTQIKFLVGSILGIIAYFLPSLVVSFLRYRRSTPQELLSFHGADAPISRSRSEHELRVFLAQLYEGGLIVSFDPSSTQAQVDTDHWAALSAEDRVTLAQVLSQACTLRSGTKSVITIEDEKGSILLTYPDDAASSGVN